MITPQMIIGTLEANMFVLRKQLEQLTHEQTMMQLPFRGNCLNWVVGHIVEHRDKMLTLLGEGGAFNEVETELYKSGSDPITTGERALPLERLFADLEGNHQRLIEKLVQLSAEDLAMKPAGSERTLGERLSGLTWHETYHVGQTEILRQLAGMNDKVI